MGRMFNLAAEAVAVREAPPAPVHLPFGVDHDAHDHDDDHDDGDAPFIEVGGPGGPVFSHQLAPKPEAGPARVAVAPPPAAGAGSGHPVTGQSRHPLGTIPAQGDASGHGVSGPQEAAHPPAVAGFPRLASAPAYLSVSFHELRVTNPAPRGDGPAAELVAFHAPEHPVSGEYRAVREEIRRQLADRGPFALYFAAAAAESGTTTVLLNLAVTLAAGDAGRVLVIDASVKRPAVGAKLGLRDAPGLAEVLAEQVPFAWAVQPTAVPNLHALAAGAAPATCRDLPRLVAQARQWFDWVLVDGGAWGEAPDRDAACPSADAVYLVARGSAVDTPTFAGLRSWVRELGGLPRGYVATRA